MQKSILKSGAFLVLVLLLACSEKHKTTSTGTSIVIEGTYNGNNLFVKNPYGTAGFGFCTTEILINGNRTSDEVNSETIEIDLKASGVREGDDIKIEIIHEKGCEPTVLNPDVLK